MIYMDTVRFITKLLISMFIGIILFIGVTYAYFLAQISGLESTSTIYMSSGTLSIVYTNGSEDIIMFNVMPGVTDSKSFTLTGINDTLESSKLMYYKIGIMKEENTFSNGAITYSLEFDSSSTNISGDSVISDVVTGGLSTGQGTEYIASGGFASSATGVNHIYNMEVSFPETGEDQSDDEGKVFRGRVVIEHANSLEL